MRCGALLCRFGALRRPTRLLAVRRCPVHCCVGWLCLALCIALPFACFCSAIRPFPGFVESDDSNGEVRFRLRLDSSPTRQVRLAERAFMPVSQWLVVVDSHVCSAFRSFCELLQLESIPDFR